MALDFDSKKALFGLAWLTLLVSLPTPGPAAESAPPPALDSESDEKRTCEINLNLIFDAIQEYRHRYRDRLPAKLSELIPEFIYDPKTLICPAEEKRWTLRDWTKGAIETEFDPHSSYSYEFTAKEIPDLFWRGLPKHNRRDWKERQMGQMQKLGHAAGLVPLVRCLSHPKKLNLGYNGSIYETELDWENEFAKGEALENLSLPGKLFADRTSPKKLSTSDFPSRDPSASPRLIDLTAYYNAQLSDGWQGFPGNDLTNMPRGLQEFNDVPFDIRGVIQLGGQEAAVMFTNQIDGIAVHQRFNRIHFLHAATFPPWPLGPANLASYVLHYESGETDEIPVIYGQNIADWWFDPKADPKGLSVPKSAQVAWEGDNQAVEAYGKLLHIYQMSWDNPLPDIEVVSISLVSRRSISAPFVIAMTVDP
jgi:hypothetical protein